jgi:hypothetical protein
MHCNKLASQEKLEHPLYQSELLNHHVQFGINDYGFLLIDSLVNYPAMLVV